MADQTNIAPGLINTAPGLNSTVTGDNPAGSGAPVTGYNAAQATAAQAKPTSYTPQSFTVTPGQTVAGQLKDILSSGSPLLEQAQASAREQMNARGLLNSTMAISAGQQGLINAALPIAAADAATNERAATNTVQAGNQALATNAGAANTASLQNSQLETQTGQFNAGQTNAALSQASQASNQVGLLSLQGQNQQALQKLVTSGDLAKIDAQGVIQTKLQEMGDKNKIVLQTSQNASQYYNTMLQYMASITTNPNMTHNQKASALNNAVTQLNDALDVMTVIAGIPGVQSTLNFTDSSLGGVSPSLDVTQNGTTYSVPLNPSVANA